MMDGGENLRADKPDMLRLMATPRSSTCGMTEESP